MPSRAVLNWVAASTFVCIALGFWGYRADERLHAADAPRKVAFLVGIKKYQKPPFPDLEWSENDVAETAVELKKLGFTVRLLTGSATGKDQATRKNILAALDETVRPLGKNDVILVMLSGHGQQFRFTEADPADPQKRREREDAFFCPVDAVNQKPETLVSFSHITDQVLSNNVGRRLVLVDACRDAPKDPNKGAKGIQGRQIALPEDTAVLFSCKAGQQSWENDDLKHSLFSYCVLEGLRGQAVRDGEITWTALLDHVTNRMASADMKGRIPADRIQTPIGAGGVERTVLGRYVATTTPVSIPAVVVPKPDLKPAPPPSKSASGGVEGQRPGQTLKNSIGMELVLIPAGKFRMGSPESEKDRSDDEAQADVTLTKAFYLGKTEVTQGQWRSVMGTTPWKGKELVKEGDNYAATYVSWDDAQAFCKKLSATDTGAYRLPTEAEWEYGCRGGKTTRFSFGDDASRLGEYAWYDKNADDIGEKYAHEVGRKQANPFGLYDMHGNVWEWCADLYAEKLPGGTDPLVSAGGSSRVYRGGGWSSHAARCRSANRLRSLPSDRNSNLGFRVSLSSGQ